MRIKRTRYSKSKWSNSSPNMVNGILARVSETQNRARWLLCTLPRTHTQKQTNSGTHTHTHIHTHTHTQHSETHTDNINTLPLNNKILFNTLRNYRNKYSEEDCAINELTFNMTKRTYT